MKKVILYIATSLDGYIAASDGGVEWLDKYQSDHEDYGYAALCDSVDAVLMGGNTYRSILGFGCEWPYAGKDVYVVSRSEWQNLPPRVTVVSEDIAPFLRRLKAGAGRNIWLVGGGRLASSLLSEGLIDEMRICVFPLLLGAGIRLFVGHASLSEWRLAEPCVYPSGAVMLTYERM